MPTIRLNKNNKTIKVVHRTDKISLKQVEKKITLHQTGRVGPVGPQGDTGISTFVRVHHQDDPNVARPNAQFVEWVGSIAPTNGTTEDTWIDTA